MLNYMYKNYLKRIIDFIIALVAIPFVLIIVIIMYPIIYFNDRGPVFYNAPRLGMNGKKFKMFKFRSMYINSPDLRNSDGSTFNSSNDPRVTKIGKFMRKTSLDEIPQFFNVLIGQMSLVGPRPTLSTKEFNEIPNEKRKRYQVRPGITGYSQAYYRNSISQDEKFRQDNYYVDHVSFLLDVKIIVKTITSVLKHDNVFVSEENKPIENKSEKLEANKEAIHK